MIPFPSRQGSAHSEERILATNLLNGNIGSGVRLVRLLRGKGEVVELWSLVAVVCQGSTVTVQQFELIADAWDEAEKERELARFRQRMLACGIADEDTPDKPVAAQPESD